ncbi:MAG: nitroreductase family protein [Gammaproteobacteria bacterium]
MELIDVIRTTHACRHYKRDDVADALLVEVLDAARWAPTGSNKQPVTWVVVRDADKRRALHELYQPLWDGIMAKYASGAIGAGFRPGFLEHVDHFARHLQDVPIMIVVCAAVDEITPVDADLGRLSVTGGSSIYPAVQNLMLAARNEGLGTTLTTILCLAEAEVKRLLGIPDELATCAMIALGWPEKPFPRKLRRKPLADIAFLDSYGLPLPGA